MRIPQTAANECKAGRRKKLRNTRGASSQCPAARAGTVVVEFEQETCRIGINLTRACVCLCGMCVYVCVRAYTPVRVYTDQIAPGKRATQRAVDVEPVSLQNL